MVAQWKCEFKNNFQKKITLLNTPTHTNEQQITDINGQKEYWIFWGTREYL